MSLLEEWLTLYLTPNLGPTGCKNLVEWFGSPGKVLKASKEELRKVRNLRGPAYEQLGRPELRQAAVEEMRRAERRGVSILCWEDREYPEWLRHIPNQPVILYLKGDAAILAEPGIGIVGSRAASTYGLRMAETLAMQLARLGVTVVSGLAQGIDTAAHRGALKGGGNTVAVLGCGLDLIYPPENRDLYQAIPERGVLVSEYPFGTRPDAFRFPARNRIISGLSRGVVVVEATGKSGSLITANLALEQGREVFAVPGQADSLKSSGCHRLLQEGAKLVTSIADIIGEFNENPGTWQTEPGTPEPEELEDDEQSILAALEHYPRSIDELIVASSLPPEKVSEVLLMLEIKGYCEVLPGQQYRTK